MRDPDDDVIILPREFRAMAHISRATEWRMRKAGEGPATVQLTEHRYAYWLSDARAWLRSRTRQSSKEKAKGAGNALGLTHHGNHHEQRTPTPDGSDL